MPENTCSDTANHDSATEAMGPDHNYYRDYAPIRVLIRGYQNGVIRFVAKGSCLERSVEWASPKLWLKCPTTLVDGVGDPLLDTSGTIYVNKDVWDHVLDPITRPYSPGLKWPENLGVGASRTGAGSRDDKRFDASAPDPGYRETVIAISSVKIEACVEGQASRAQFELRDPALPEQRLDLDDVIATLVVAAPGGGKPQRTRMQVLHAIAHGTCLSTGIHRTIDLMDPTLADTKQVIDLAKRPTSLRLSAIARGMFGLGGHP